MRRLIRPVGKCRRGVRQQEGGQHTATSQHRLHRSPPMLTSSARCCSSLCGSAEGDRFMGSFCTKVLPQKTGKKSIFSRPPIGHVPQRSSDCGGGHITSAIHQGCAKTPAFDLRVESSTQFGQSEDQKLWRRLYEEGNRENDFTLSRLAHVFT